MPLADKWVTHSEAPTNSSQQVFHHTSILIAGTASQAQR